MKGIRKKINDLITRTMIAALCLLPLAAFSQPVPQTMTLDECLKAADRSNLGIQRQISAQQRAASDVTLARLLLNPAFTSLVRVNARSSDAALVNADDALFLNESARVGVAVSYPLYDAGRRRSLLKAARIGLQGQQEQTRQIVRDTRLQTIQAYYTLLRTQQRMANDALSISAATENLRGAEERFRLGAVTRSDTLLAQSVLSVMEAVREENKALLGVAQARLAGVIGADAARVAPVAVTPIPAALPTEQNVNVLVEQASRQSPEYARVLLAREAQQVRLSVLRSERLPTLSLSAGTGYIVQGGTGSGEYYLFSAQISLPLFDTPRLQARERNLKSELQEQELEIQQQEQTLRELIVTVFAQYQARTARLKSSQSALAFVLEASRLAQERYQVGRGTQSETLDAMMRLASARQSVSDAQSDLDLILATWRLLTQREAQTPERR